MASNDASNKHKLSINLDNYKGNRKLGILVKYRVIISIIYFAVFIFVTTHK